MERRDEMESEMATQQESITVMRRMSQRLQNCSRRHHERLEIGAKGRLRSEMDKIIIRWSDNESERTSLE